MGQHRAVQFRRGLVFGIGWYAPGMGWMWFLTAPGYVVAVVIFSVFVGTAVALTPYSAGPGRGRRGVPAGSGWAWCIGLPAAMTIAEAIRFCFPFGGVPLASLAVSQVAGPLSGVARIGGPVLLTWVTLQLGVALGLVQRHLGPTWATGPDPSGRHVRAGLGGLAATMAVVVASLVAPTGAGDGTEPIEVAFVQGGGPQGTRAVDTDPREVVERHLDATRSLAPGPDLIVWPENVIDVELFTDSVERDEVAAEAARLGAPILVGITEEATDRDAFLNAQVVVLPDGTVSSRYEKVRRVPFGEYMPLRGLLKALGAPVDLVPRDAVAGTGPAFLETPVGRVAVVISWEVFFAGRARDGVSHGGRLLVNPTNGSSYTGTVLQTQQVASSRLRAIENGRWLVQVAPTGFSAFVDPDGGVHQRTGVSERAVRTMEVELRDGRTLANRLGDIPFVALAVAVVVATVARSGRRRPGPAPRQTGHDVGKALPDEPHAPGVADDVGGG